MLHNEARKRVLEAWDKTHNAREIAKYFSVNESTVYRLIEERARTGSYETRTQLRGRKTILTEKQHHDILELVQEQPDITMKEIVDYFLSGCEKGNLYLQEINKFDENIYLYMTCGFETEMVFKLQCNVFDNMWNTNPTYYKIYRAGGKLYVERLAKE